VGLSDNVAFAGTLTGIAGVAPGRNLQLKPFLAAQIQRETPTGSGWRADGDGGVDLKWGITSSSGAQVHPDVRILSSRSVPAALFGLLPA